MRAWDATQRKRLRDIAGMVEHRQKLVDLAEQTNTKIDEQHKHLVKLRAWLDDGERSLEVLQGHAEYLGELLGEVRA